MGRLTTHVLDLAHGCPGAGIRIALYRADERAPIVERVTDADGRCDGPLLAGAAMHAGAYRLVFHVGDYFAARGVALPEPRFLDRVGLDFGIADTSAHYHVPLLVSPYGYTTYRGS